MFLGPYTNVELCSLCTAVHPKVVHLQDEEWSSALVLYCTDFTQGKQRVSVPYLCGG